MNTTRQQRLWCLRLRAICQVGRCHQVDFDSQGPVTHCELNPSSAASRALVASLAEGAALDHSQSSLKGVNAGPRLCAVRVQIYCKILRDRWRV